jgi:hypothetical protein
MSDTWDTHSGEDMVERVVLPGRSRIGGKRVQDMGDAHAVRYSRGLVVDPRKNTHRYIWWVFDRVWPQNLAVAVLVGIRGGTWRHHGGCIEAKQLRAECVAIRSKSQELVHFSPG